MAKLRAVAQDPVQLAVHEVPGAHVRRLLLDPPHLVAAGVLVGERDELFRAEQFKPLFAQLNPKIAISVEPELGHMTMIGDPRGTAAVATLKVASAKPGRILIRAVHRATPAVPTLRAISRWLSISTMTGLATLG